MRPTLFILCCFIFYGTNTYAQFESTYADSTYIVRFVDTISPEAKEDFYIRFRSKLLCEMKFGDFYYAWLQFKDFDGPFIDIEGGVIGAQSDPVIDGTSLDHFSEHSATAVSSNIGCISNFDVTMRMGAYPVDLYNLDTGVSLPMTDNSDPIPELDFSGDVECLIPGTGIAIIQTCEDLNGHGTHGVGIQQNLINLSEAKYGIDSPINIKSYQVFNEFGVGNLGAILCALSDIVADTTALRQVVNCSFSFLSGPSISTIDPLADAFRTMAAEDIFSVVAAGNDSMEIGPSFPIYPASYFSEYSGGMAYDYSMLTVGAANCDQTPGAYSNFSQRVVDVATLGVWPGPNRCSGIVFYEGTSQATFATSAISAMLMSHQPVPNLAKLKCSIMSSSVIDPAFRDLNTSSGILSASMALLLMENGCIIQDACPPTHVVTGIIPSGDFESSYSVISNGYISNSQVNFNAKDHIILQAGFLVGPSALFEAYIEGCENTLIREVKE